MSSSYGKSTFFLRHLCLDLAAESFPQRRWRNHVWKPRRDQVGIWSRRKEVYDGIWRFSPTETQIFLRLLKAAPRCLKLSRSIPKVFLKSYIRIVTAVTIYIIFFNPVKS